MSKIAEGLTEALAVAKGDEPAARLYVNGHYYVPETKLEEAQKLINQYRARLEIDHYFTADTANGGMKRVDVPVDDPAGDGIPDGVECRDDTIKLLDENIDRLSEVLRATRENAAGMACVLRGVLEYVGRTADNEHGVPNPEANIASAISEVLVDYRNLISAQSA